jgi:predicted permease
MPDWRGIVGERLRASGVDPDRNRSLVDELAQHLEDRYRATRASGATDDAAHAAALAELDGSDSLARELTPVEAAPVIAAGGPAARPLAGLAQDVRYAVRTLRRSPAFTAAAVLTIALCTGPTTAAIGVANWLFLRPPPGVSDPGRLGVVWFGSWANEGRSFSPSDVSYRQLAAMTPNLTTIAGIAGQMNDSVNLTSAGAAPRVAAAQIVTANFFDVVGAGLAAGRGFHPDDERDPGGAPVVVLAHDVARGLFGSADTAVGRTVRVNDQDWVVIGVAAPGFAGTMLSAPISLWVPGRAAPRLAHLPRERWENSAPFYEFVVRLRGDATFAQADAELRSVARALADGADPDAQKYGEDVEPRLFAGLGVMPVARETMRTFAARLFGVAAVLVLLGLANLVNLFVFRAARRSHEAAIRQSLGASAARLAQLHLVEAVIVSVAGVALGVAIAAAAGTVLDGIPVSAVGALTVAIDWRTLAAAGALAIGVSVCLSAASLRLRVGPALSMVTPGVGRTATRRGTRLRNGLAVVQVALSLTLLVGGLLFVQTLRQLHAVDLGIDVENVSTFTFELRGQGYDIDRTRRFYRELVERVAEQPGVEAVAGATGVPLTSSSGMRVLPPALAAQTGLSTRELAAQSLRVLSNDVTPDYFRVTGMRVIAGRTFTVDEAYATGPSPAVVISAALAEKLFGTVQAAGRRLSFPAQGSLPRYEAAIVGVVNDVRWRGPRRASDEMVYLPFGNVEFQNWLMVRSPRPAGEVSRLVQHAAAGIDPNAPASWDRTMTDVFTRRVADELVMAWTLGVLSAVGVALAIVGIYGLVSQSVVERVREFGIRVAIGAGRGEIVRLVARQAVVIAGIGIPLGLVSAGWGSKLVAAQLFGVTPLAPGVYAVAVISLICAVIVAVVAPARRAVGVNPVDVMRAE